MRTLTMDELATKVPAAFNTVGPTASVSDRYKFVPSLPIIEGIMAGGFAPVAAYQPRARHQGGSNFGTHFVRFRATTNLGLLKKDDTVQELIYSNAHNGLASNRLTLGIHRCWCDNQATVKEGDLYSHAIRHVGKIQSEIVLAMAKVLGSAPLLQHRIDTMKSVDLTQEQQETLALTAIIVRWGRTRPLGGDLVRQVLSERRSQDSGPQFWRVYNRIQENIIKGDFYTRDVTKKSGQALVRPVKSFVSQTEINQKLWSAATVLLKQVT